MASNNAFFYHSLEATEENHEIPQLWRAGNQSLFEQGVYVGGDEKNIEWMIIR